MELVNVADIRDSPNVHFVASGLVVHYELFDPPQSPSHQKGQEFEEGSFRCGCLQGSHSTLQSSLFRSLLMYSWYTIRSHPSGRITDVQGRMTAAHIASSKFQWLEKRIEITFSWCAFVDCHDKWRGIQPQALLFRKEHKCVYYTIQLLLLIYLDLRTINDDNSVAQQLCVTRLLNSRSHSKRQRWTIIQSTVLSIMSHYHLAWLAIFFYIL